MNCDECFFACADVMCQQFIIIAYETRFFVMREVVYLVTDSINMSFSNMQSCKSGIFYFALFWQRKWLGELKTVLVFVLGACLKVLIFYDLLIAVKKV